MLPKSHRLTKKELLFLFKNGRQARSPFFSGHTLVTTPSSGNKIAVSVTKKAAASAVTRNAYKRMFFSSLDSLGRKKEGRWIAIVVHTLPEKEQAEKELGQFMKKLL